MSDRMTVYLRVAAVLAMMALAVLAGLWAGRVSVPDYLASESNADGTQNPPETPLGGSDIPVEPKAPPLFFFIGDVSDVHHAVVLEEIAMAAAAGIHQYIVPIPAPWDDAALPYGAEILQAVVGVDPKAAFLMQVDLNPPTSWLEAHPEDAVLAHGERQPFPTAASTIWLDDARSALQRLIQSLENSPLMPRVRGYIPAALADGRWYHRAGFDVSPANLAGFRNWLRRAYADDAALKASWANDAVTLDTAPIPPEPGDDLHQVFFALPQMRILADFRRYTSESVANVIAALAAQIKTNSATGTIVLAPYGFSYEILDNDAGHFALGALLDSDLDGFISPFSYTDRGLGGAGGMMGPVHSARYHGKQWFMIDDTRTGIEGNPATGDIARIRGIRAEDVYNVQRRNFAAALVNGLGLIWADPMGEGWLHDTGQWEEFGRMHAIYARTLVEDANNQLPENTSETISDTTPPDAAPPLSNPLSQKLEQDPLTSSGKSSAIVSNIPEPAPLGTELSVDEEPNESVEGAAESFDMAVIQATPLIPGEALLMVVVDESARCYQQCDEKLNELLLHQARDTALRAGIATQFVLLQDVLDDIADPASVYLFLNAFRLRVDERARLHARLEREKSCAIWMYAPGYIDERPDPENITVTIGMQVKRFDEPARTGSTFRLTGRWMKQDESFGDALDIAPLFYIDDDEADVLAYYRASNRSSVAIRAFPAGWTSVFVADPNLSPGLLREILRILEQPLCFRPAARSYFDAAFLGNDLLAVHGKEVGERVIGLGRFCDVVDLFDASIGWPEKESFLLPLKMGETRLLKLSPL